MVTRADLAAKKIEMWIFSEIIIVKRKENHVEPEHASLSASSGHLGTHESLSLGG